MKKSPESQVFFSSLVSFFIHLCALGIIYFILHDEDFKKHSNENYEIVDAEIVGLVNQSKSPHEQINQSTVIASQPDMIVENDSSKIENDPVKKLEKNEPEIENKSQKEQKPIEKPAEIKNDVKTETKVEEKIIKPEQIDRKKEAEKIEKALKEFEKKQKLQKEVNELKKASKNANKAVSNTINKGKSIQSDKIIGGGDAAMAKLGSYIKTQIVSCWKIPPLIGVENDKIFVVMKLYLDQDGNVTKYSPLNKGNIGNQKFFDIILKSAENAINTCSPIKNLPKDRYDEWKEIVLNFDPSKIVGQ
jgi:hypothetical protein